MSFLNFTVSLLIFLDFVFFSHSTYLCVSLLFVESRRIFISILEMMNAANRIFSFYLIINPNLIFESHSIVNDFTYTAASKTDFCFYTLGNLFAFNCHCIAMKFVFFFICPRSPRSSLCKKSNKKKKENQTNRQCKRSAQQRTLSEHRAVIYTTAFIIPLTICSHRMCRLLWNLLPFSRSSQIHNVSPKKNPYT